MKKKIKIKLVDGFEHVIGKDSYYYKELEKRYDIELSDNPDYLLCSCFSGEFLNYDCIKIVVLAENITPDFNLYDYATGFDFLTYEDRYVRIPNYVYYRDSFRMAAEKHLNTDEFFLNKKKFCNFVYSNTNSDRSRNDFYLALSEYKKVDAGGKIFNNIGGRIQNKYEFQKDYKFSIAFENSQKEGYTTEKIVQAWQAGTIPIYWGNTRVIEEFNPKAFINVFDFDSYESCIEYIKKVDQNDELYLSIQKEPIFTEESLAKQYHDNPDMLIDFLCEIFDKPIEEARKIYTHGNGYTKFYLDIMKKGWRTKTICQKIKHMIKG